MGIAEDEQYGDEDKNQNGTSNPPRNPKPAWQDFCKNNPEDANCSQEMNNRMAELRTMVRNYSYGCTRNGIGSVHCRELAKLYYEMGEIYERKNQDGMAKQYFRYAQSKGHATAGQRITQINQKQQREARKNLAHSTGLAGCSKTKADFKTACGLGHAQSCELYKRMDDGKVCDINLSVPGCQSGGGKTNER